MSFDVIKASSRDLGSPARTQAPDRDPLVVGVVQAQWNSDPAAHLDNLEAGVRLAVDHGAQLVCMQELTLSPYFAVSEEFTQVASSYAESIDDGPTVGMARRLAAETGAAIHASLYEAADDGGLGYNTAICVAADGELLARTRKLHIPRFPGYHEDLCFRAGDGDAPAVELLGTRVGFPTCWDQWFPELARIYSLAGAEILVYPTAIGSEPDISGFDSEPQWRQMVSANGLANATFMVVANRIGTERGLTFYGSSFVSDPYGRVLAQAPRDRQAVLVVELDLDQRRDWLSFGLLDTRRPDFYQPLMQPSATAVAER